MKKLLHITKRLTIYLLMLNLIAQNTFVTPAFAQTSTDSAQKTNTLPISSSPAISPADPSIPTVDIETKSQTSAFIKTSPVVQRLAKKYYRSDEEVLVSIMNPQDDSFHVALSDTKGTQTDVAVQQLPTNNNLTTFAISPRAQFRPGKYKLTISDASGKNSEQDFNWGVLALNTDRSIYLPGQTADIAMAVLDEQGEMVCDSNLELKIQNTQLKTNDLLSTENKKITVNPQCQSHKSSLEPDYEAHYQVGEPGTYTLTLTAQNKNGTYSITDQLIVKNTVPFDVQRTSTTRIFPQNNYPVQLNITANQDFNGQITETVPDSFTITAADNTKSYDNMQTIYMKPKLDPTNTLDQQVLGASTSALALPFTGNYPITEGFGTEQTEPSLRKLYTKFGLAGHDGVDFGLPMETPVLAVDDGNVVLAGKGDYGTTIIIQHTWGKSYYGHLSKVTVAEKTSIHKGDQIALSGNTGEATTGPHLHFGMKPNTPDMQNGYFGKIDPLPYLNLPEPASPPPDKGELEGVLPTATNSAVLGASTSAASTNQVRPEILDNPTTANYDKVKVLTWNISIKKGEKISLGYTFKAPDLSPQFYLLGPLRFYGNPSTTPTFEETRQWQIAADAVGTRWYNYNWQYRKQITIDHTKVSTADQTNFPVLVNLSSDTNLSANAQSTGNDILFTDSTGQTKLNHEIEKYTSGTGELEAWVNVPTLSHSSDTIIYIYYGNAAATNQQSVNNTWNSNSTGIWHLKETSGNQNDSTSNANNLTTITVTAEGSATGQIDGADTFNGSTDYLRTNNTTTGLLPTDITVDAWINFTELPSVRGGASTVAVKYTSNGSNPFFAYILEVDTNNHICFGWWNTTPTNYEQCGTTALTTGVWYYVTGRYISSTHALQVFLNGATEGGTTTTTGTIYTTNPAQFGISNGGTATFNFHGSIDEVRVANTNRSDGWTATEYNNQNSPSTFYTLGSIETKAYAPTNDELMRHGKWMCPTTSCSVNPGMQPFTF